MTVDAKELMKLNQGFEKYRNAIPTSTTNAALARSARPLLNSARQLAPIGTVRSNGWGKYTGPDYRRGGRATQRDVRIKRVTPEGEEVARILVGVSDKSGHVGWRTHFITKGWKDRGGKWHKGKDFLQDAYDYTFEIVQTTFYKELFSNLVKWGKLNLPQ